MIANLGFHRRGNAQRFVDAPEVVVHVVDRQRVRVVFNLFAESVGFLMLERLSGIKKNAAQFKTPALPEGFRPRGAFSDAAARPVVHRNSASSAGPRHRSKSFNMSVLRKVVCTAI